MPRNRIGCGRQIKLHLISEALGVHRHALSGLPFQIGQQQRGQQQSDDHQPPEHDTGDLKRQADTGNGVIVCQFDVVIHLNPISFSDSNMGHTPLNPAPKIAKPINQGINQAWS